MSSFQADKDSEKGPVVGKVDVASLLQRHQSTKDSTNAANIDNAEEENPVNPEDEGIHPDWLAMERRVKFRKPKPRKSADESSRTLRRPSAWDGEHV